MASTQQWAQIKEEIEAEGKTPRIEGASQRNIEAPNYLERIRKAGIVEENASIEAALAAAMDTIRNVANHISSGLRGLNKISENVEKDEGKSALYISKKEPSETPYKVIFLEGEPGTGKTFTAEFVLSKWIEKVLNTVTSDEPPKDKKELLKNIDKLIPEAKKTEKKEESLREIFKEDVKKGRVVLNKPLEEIVNTMAKRMEQVGDERIKKDLQRVFTTMYYDILTSHVVKGLKNLKWKEKIVVDKVVMPAQETSSEFIEKGEYKVRRKEILKKEVTSKLLSLIGKAAEGHFTILILDELSELVKIDSEKSPKILHPFFDAYLKGDPYEMSISEEELSPETKNIVNRLVKEGLAKWTSEKSLRIEIPPNFIIIGTGNIRDSESDNIVGLMKSTKERLFTYRVTYIPPEGVEHFLEEKLNEWYEKAGGREVNLDRNSLKTIKTEILKTYKALYEQWKEKKVHILPSLRNIEGAAKAVFRFYTIEKVLQSMRLGEKEIGKMRGLDMPALLEKVESTDRGTIKMIQKVSFNFDNNIPSLEEVLKKIEVSPEGYLNFICAMLRAQAHIKTGSIMIRSEVDKLDTTQVEITLDKVFKEVKDYLPDSLEKDRDLVVLELNGEKSGYSYYLSPIYYMYLLSTFTSLLAGQKFFFYTGITQEGKTTMSKKILPYLLNTLIKEMKRNKELENGLFPFFPFEGIKMVDIENPSEEAQLVEGAIKVEESESEGNEKSLTGEPKLLSVVKEAQKHKDILYLVTIDEIDALDFTQHLNELLTSDTLHLGEEVYDVSNIIVIGTSNVSTQYIDNFISRAVLVYYFSPELSKVATKPEDIDGKIYLPLLEWTTEILAVAYGDENKAASKSEILLRTFFSQLEENNKELSEAVKSLRVHDVLGSIQQINPLDAGLEIKERMEEESEEKKGLKKWEIYLLGLIENRLETAIASKGTEKNNE